jgi:soluble lytic murein transglycosylase
MTDFLADNPDWPRRDALIRQAERAMPAGMRAEEVVRWFDGRAPMTPEGVIKLLGAYRAAKQTTLMERIANDAWIRLDFDRAQEDAYKRNFISFTDRGPCADRRLLGWPVRPGGLDACPGG